MECPDCLLKVCQIFHWLLGVVLVRLAFPFDQVLESLSAPWCLRVYDVFYLIYVWIIHISANNRA